jgi:Domain of Unknown Function (DUF1599).
MCTNEQFDAVTAKCRKVFADKLQDYGASWRILRPTSLTDQLFIKAKRIRSIEVKGESKVQEGIYPEFMGIVNYGVVGLIQLQLGYVDKVDMTNEEALSLYDEKIAMAKSLMLDKNHDYDEAWRGMRISSYTDMILTKLNRTKEIEDHAGKTLVSEGIDANYLDMMNYAIFGLIRMDFDK